MRCIFSSCFVFRGSFQTFRCSSDTQRRNLGLSQSWRAGGFFNIKAATAGLDEAHYKNNVTSKAVRWSREKSCGLQRWFAQHPSDSRHLILPATSTRQLVAYSSISKPLFHREWDTDVCTIHTPKSLQVPCLISDQNLIKTFLSDL